MQNVSNISYLAQRVLHGIYSVPIYIKIMGIGILVTLIFGVVSYYSIRASMYQTHYEIHAETVHSIAASLSARLAAMPDLHDEAQVAEEIQTTIESFPDVRYILVQDASERVLNHEFTFPSEIPRDLLARDRELCASCHALAHHEPLRSDLLEVQADLEFPEAQFQAWRRPGGIILEIIAPIRNGKGGTVRVGVGDTLITREVASVTRALMTSLGICLVIGLLLSFGLTYALVHPIQNLVQTANRLRVGEFDARAQVYSNDEIGKLARSFNLMADELQTYRREVEAKEAERLALMKKLVHAQEEERKSVARELHDQLGQSLSNVLLSLQNICTDCNITDARCGVLEGNIRGLIDEVGRLAWEIRPSVLDDYGLESALQRHIEKVSKQAGITIDYQSVHTRNGDRLPNHIEVPVYRVAQESLRNVVRHSQATRASVILIQHPADITLIVEDDGCGFEVPKVFEKRNAAMGLLGMRERIGLIGGNLTIESEPGKGTVLRVRIPITNGFDARGK